MPEDGQSPWREAATRRTFVAKLEEQSATLGLKRGSEFVCFVSVGPIGAPLRAMIERAIEDTVAVNAVIREKR